MVIQRAWASIIGLASATIGVLRILSIVNIPLRDALIHIATGVIFIAGAWLKRGIYVRLANFFLGVFYILFGIIGGFNWPHIIAGAVSVVISVAFRVKPG